MSNSSNVFGLGAAATLVSAFKLWGPWGGLLIIGLMAMILAVFSDLMKKK